MQEIFPQSSYGILKCAITFDKNINSRETFLILQSPLLFQQIQGRQRKKQKNYIDVFTKIEKLKPNISHKATEDTEKKTH